MVKDTEIVVRQKTAGTVDGFIFVRLTEREAAQEALFNFWNVGNIFGRIAADEPHVKQAADVVKIRKVGELAFARPDGFETSFKLFQFHRRVKKIHDDVRRERVRRRQVRASFLQAGKGVLRLAERGEFQRELKMEIGAVRLTCDFRLQHFHVAVEFFGFKIAVVPQLAAQIHARKRGNNLLVNAALKFCSARKQPRDERAGALRLAVVFEIADDFQPADLRGARDEIFNFLREIFTGQPQFFEWIHCRADGTPFNAEVSLNRLELHGQPVIQAIVRDITARKQAEAARREAEELYRTLVHTSPDGITVLDLEGRVQYSSPKALELFQRRADPADPPRHAFEYVAAGELARAQNILRDAVAGKIATNERFTMTRQDGSQFVAELNGALLRDGLGIPRGLMIITRDVTDRQRQEDELKNKNSELERFTTRFRMILKVRSSPSKVSPARCCPIWPPAAPTV